MVTHPHCGFSRRAFKEFDESTKEYLSEHGVFIAPVREKYEAEELGGVIEWNKNHPNSQHTPIYSKNKLKDLDLDRTPQFYFFRNGKLLNKVVGWPKDKTSAKLVQKNIRTLEGI